MKLIFSLLVSITLSANITAQLKKFETAVAYNDFIIAEQVKIGKVIQDFVSAFSKSSDSTEVHRTRKAIATQVDSSVIQVKKMQAFKGDTALKKAAISLFLFYGKAAANEYTQLVRISFNSKLSQEEKTKQMTGILDTVSKTEAVFDKSFSDAQQAFASKHNINLTENEFKLNE
jgi:hypothetical protein